MYTYTKTSQYTNEHMQVSNKQNQAGLYFQVGSPVGMGSLGDSPEALSSLSFSLRAAVLPFHSFLGSSSTTTTSPWMERFRAFVPWMRMSLSRSVQHREAVSQRLPHQETFQMDFISSLSRHCWGWRGGSVGEVLTIQARGSEFGSPVTM